MIVHKENMENLYVKFWIENRILHVRYKPDLFIDLEAARIIVADRVNFQKGKAYPILCYTEGIISMNKPARDYLAIKGSILTKAVAYIAAPTVSLAMLGFFVEKNEPSIPSDIFSDEFAAKHFLKPYID